MDLGVISICMVTKSFEQVRLSRKQIKIKIKKQGQILGRTKDTEKGKYNGQEDRKNQKEESQSQKANCSKITTKEFKTSQKLSVVIGTTHWF